MITLENQTLYQCEYCEKRFVTKSGVRRHERKYCYLSPIPKERREERVRYCNHQWETHYDYIPGEAAMEPQYQYCIHCGVEHNNYLAMKWE